MDPIPHWIVIGASCVMLYTGIRILSWMYGVVHIGPSLLIVILALVFFGPDRVYDVLRGRELKG